jgi:uncharacterized RDD family membrane protein YckC
LAGSERRRRWSIYHSHSADIAGIADEAALTIPFSSDWSLGWLLPLQLIARGCSADLGKRLLGLRVVSLGEKGSLMQATIRSVPKFFWYIFLPIDTLAGLATQGDPRQRWSDKVSETTVVAMRLPHKDRRPRSMQRTSETSTK